MAHDVFISHSSKDKAMADATCATLEAKGIRCWIAPRDVPPGEVYAAALNHAITSSRVFVLILSEGSNTSNHVIRELELAADRGIPILPMRIEEIVPSAAMGFYIKSIHWLDALTPPRERHLEDLYVRVHALLSVDGEKAPPPLAEPRVKPPEPKRSAMPVWAIVLLALAAVVILGGGGFWVFSNRGGSNAENEPVSDTSQDGVVDSSASSQENTNGSEPTGEDAAADEWQPVDFFLPSPRFWKVEGDDQLTALLSRDQDAYAWSKETYQGDLALTVDLYSAVEAVELSFAEMDQQVPTQSSGCVIIYGNGNTDFDGSLNVCVHWDGYFIDDNTPYDGEYIASVHQYTPSQTVYSLSIEIIDDLAILYVNGENVLSAVFDTQKIDRVGRIGLFTYWSDGEITFSNIEVKTGGTE